MRGEGRSARGAIDSVAVCNFCFNFWAIGNFDDLVACGVRGITTEYSGRSLALFEIAHWYENVLLLGFVWLFFAFNPALGVAAALVTYLFEVFVDNAYARLTWKVTVRSSWVATLLLGVTNLVAIEYFFR